MKSFLVVAAGLFAVSLTVAGHAEVKPARPPSARSQPRPRAPQQPPRDGRGSAVRRIRGLRPLERRLRTDGLMRGLITAPAFPPEIWLESRPGR
jgi:hypothetical protein